jgi:hypothetical protein
VETQAKLNFACRDGTLLVHLLQHLDGCRLPGVSDKPKSSAATLFNVRSVLTRLRDKPAMPVQCLWSERDIVDGEPGVAAHLLWHMYALYQGMLGGGANRWG